MCASACLLRFMIMVPHDKENENKDEKKEIIARLMSINRQNVRVSLRMCRCLCVCVRLYVSDGIVMEQLAEILLLFLLSFKAMECYKIPCERAHQNVSTVA